MPCGSRNRIRALEAPNNNLYTNGTHVVGVEGLEPSLFRSQSERDTKLRHTPARLTSVKFNELTLAVSRESDGVMTPLCRRSVILAASGASSAS